MLPQSRDQIDNHTFKIKNVQNLYFFLSQIQKRKKKLYLVQNLTKYINFFNSNFIYI
jgi:hypothetical protein